MNRRTLIQAGAGAVAAAMVPGLARATVTEFQPLPSANDERLKMLILTAMDAAKSAGADYADGRLTFTQYMEAGGRPIAGGTYLRPFNRREHMAIGVRARCDGYWGFSSSTVWSKDEAARIGRMAVDGARANFSATNREIDMAPNPNASSGNWAMPIQDDPFEMDPAEICDYLMGLGEYMETISNEHPRPFGVTLKQKIDANFHRQQKAFGNTEGQFVTQRLYRTGARVSFEVNTVEDGLGGGLAAGVLKQLNPFGAGAGFEALRNPQIRGWLRELYEELGQESLLPAIPVDVGKFDCLIHPDAVAQLIKKSIGVATEIDRVMGFEANTTGTSYITDPNQELGALKIGSSALNITATRSKPGGLMHMKWDDEGVAPKDVQLVKNGVLSNLQTGREGTAWMKGYLQKSGQPILSNGSVFGIDAHEPQSIHPSDLILHPDPSQDTTLGQLREHMSEGLEFKHGHVLMDFQQSTGMMVNYMAFQIKKGKRVARVVNPGALFRTSQLWGNMKALGGPGSSYCVGTGDFKSNPSRIAYSSVYAPPVLIKELSIINPAQKA